MPMSAPLATVLVEAMIADARALEALASALVAQPLARQALLAAMPASASSSSPWMTTEEVAAYLRCSPQRVREMVTSGRLERQKDGARNLYRRSDVERLVVDPA